jgi:hypothetical protein
MHTVMCLATATQVLIYVDGVKVGETSGGEQTPHLMINRLCEGETSDSDGSVSTRLGFRQQLPPLPPGRHQVGHAVQCAHDPHALEYGGLPLGCCVHPALQFPIIQVRAFVRRPGDTAKQELNQSPLQFIESPYPSDAQQALARKDAIIRVRNAQVGKDGTWCVRSSCHNR